MKITVQGYDVEGTPQEMREFLQERFGENVSILSKLSTEKEQKKEPKKEVTKRRKRKRLVYGYKNQRKGWTKEDDVFLEENFGKLSINDLVKKLQRNKKSIRERARRKGLPRTALQPRTVQKRGRPEGIRPKRSQKRWGEEELQKLKVMYEGNVTMQEMEKEFKRTSGNIYMKVSELKKKGFMKGRVRVWPKKKKKEQTATAKKKPAPAKAPPAAQPAQERKEPREWSEAEKQYLRQNWSEGKNLQFLMRAMDRSEEEVKLQVWTLGLVEFK